MVTNGEAGKENIRIANERHENNTWQEVVKKTGKITGIERGETGVVWCKGWIRGG